MSLWSHITNVFRSERLRSEIDEEREWRLTGVVEQGRDPAEERRAFGPSRTGAERVASGPADW
jgi:hypothetical protein